MFVIVLDAQPSKIAFNTLLPSYNGLFVKDHCDKLKAGALYDWCILLASCLNYVMGFSLKYVLLASSMIDN